MEHLNIDGKTVEKKNESNLGLYIIVLVNVFLMVGAIAWQIIEKR